ncbi:serine hydrolase [Hwangdonia lutea]|uniref:Serine hydrolase n=1 Tax=Hwangdonia lutea TaxID=3075823 RepID=A0AA97ES41_9FLAO|nr:serine hydrolase [Hwangdonia sp. SCSIO 19198]WOD44888.1 serine hydrolase [Hwangdonia sp. SCSIO 19198]
MRCFFLIAIILFSGCKNDSADPIETVLASNNPKIKTVADAIENHEVQILFTEIIREKDSVYFKDYSFQVDDNSYFYPASTVKLPIAILALEKVKDNPLIDRNTLFNVEGDSTKTTISNAIKKIFAVSDNAAYNRLFEYLGKDYINNKLIDKGINCRISHRLSVDNSTDLKTKPLIFYAQNQVVFKTDAVINQPIKPLKLNEITKGKGYMVNDSLVNQPMDFSLKNYLPVTALHQIMKRLMFPELYPHNQQFHLTPIDRSFLINTMKILPHEAGYTTDDYYESYVKFLVFGDSKKPLPKHIKIYNKVGNAYGYLTDCAYIINEKTKQEFLITATIHVNKNQIFNDNNYEYDTVGFPFLAALGRQLIE